MFLLVFSMLFRNTNISLGHILPNVRRRKERKQRCSNSLVSKYLQKQSSQLYPENGRTNPDNKGLAGFAICGQTIT